MFKILKLNYFFVILPIFILFSYLASTYVQKRSNPEAHSIDNLNRESEIINSSLTNVLYECKSSVTYENDKAVFTLLTEDDNYAQSAIKLLKSIRQTTPTKFDAYVLEISQKPLRDFQIDKLIKAGWKICRVDRIAPRDEKNTFPRFRDQFTKLVLWKMIQFKTIVYFDSDAFVIRNIEHMFNIYEKFEPDVYLGVTRDIRASEWQTGFNMGVFVLKPDELEFDRLIRLKNEPKVKFETTMSEQGFLNVVYEKKWYEIGFENNANLAVYSAKNDYWKERQNRINVIHYTMTKPWACGNEYLSVCALWKNFTC